MFFVTPQLGRARGGLGVSAQRIVGHLRRHERVAVFALSDELPPATYERSYDGLLTRISSLGDRRVSYQLLCDRMLAEAAVAKPSRVAAFYASDLSWAAHLGARLLDVPLLVFARGNDIDLDPFGESGPRILATLAAAERVFCVSRELQRKISRWAPTARTTYVANGVDPDAFAPVDRAPVGDKIPVGIFGELKAKKGLELLIGQLDFEQFSLRIVGSLRAEPEKFLHGFCTLFPERATAIEHVLFQSEVTALRSAYASVDIVCLPSLHEGMSNVMLEAMSTGAVCVASRIGGALDVIRDGENGFAFVPGDEADLGRALERAAEAVRDPQQRVSQQARATIVEGFGAEHEANAYALAMRS